MEADFTCSHYFAVKVTFNATETTVASAKPPSQSEHPNKESGFCCSNMVLLLKLSQTVSENEQKSNSFS